MITRRKLLKNLSALPIVGGLIGTGVLSANTMNTAPKKKPSSDLFKELGVTPVINANVTMTFLSGSLMKPEVLEAINSTAHDFANMYELQDKIGAKMAEMLHCEAAMVTSGAACAMVLGTAAAITGMDEKKRKLLPNLPGPRPEVIMQKSHRYVFDQAITTTGAVIVEVEGPDEMQQAMNNNTVMTLFFNAAGSSSISHEEFVAISKRNNIPSFIDAAADVPPVENLFKFQKMGFDLVTFSGGKMIRGPQSAGLLFGKKDLIEAAKLNHSPHEAPIGRPMKVNKEEMFGMYVALKEYLETDHEAEWQEWLDRIEYIKSRVESLSSVKGKTHIHPGPANAFPSMLLSWDQNIVKTTPREVYETLKNGTPSIVSGLRRDGESQMLVIGVVLLKSEQVSIVAERLYEILKQATKE
ncbi:aminotransferase class V-fold PLP-dependent enzyme [Pareuzebyella sediminis]|uniref:aminotransferase class V-fold PLP-dependent enzyme n=1 Tax=Pareuzebyella sediminis TaxID=2607998 RepID=UPI0011F01214|nr:aminotransferase class V-fold PLP-dependent enzyme [Pareuzebyella sediminis]